MKKKYKINEVAKLFGISKQTLIYYDRIGVFKPYYIDEENSYRYYVEEQFFQLKFILLLKIAGFSLKEIKEYTETKSPQESLIYLEKKLKDIDEKFINLQESKKLIELKVKEIKKISTKIKEKPKIITMNKKRMFTLLLKQKFSFEDYDTTYRELLKLKKNLGIEGNEFMQEMSKECIDKENYMVLNSRGFFIPEERVYIDGERTTEEGKYASLVHMDAWEKIGDSYDVLKAYIKEEGYKISGNAIEILSDVTVHLGKGSGTSVRIYIPIKKLEK